MYDTRNAKTRYSNKLCILNTIKLPADRLKAFLTKISRVSDRNQNGLNNKWLWNTTLLVNFSSIEDTFAE
jgi:hypothetical protein